MGSNTQNLLIIDNDQVFVDEIRRLFEAQGLEVVHTVDPDYAMNTAEQQMPVMIVLNADVPKGFALCRKIKKDPKLANIPLVLTTLTASEDTIERHKTLPTRADYYFRKPVSAGELLNLLPKKGPDGAGQDASRIQEMESRISQLNKERDTLLNRLSELEALEKETRAYKDTIKTLEESNKVLQERVDGLEAELAAKEAMANENADRIEEIKQKDEEIENLSQQIESMTALFEKLENGYKQQIEDLQTDNKNLSEKVLELERKNEDLEEQQVMLESRTSEYESLKEKAEQVEELQAANQQMIQELQELRAYKERMQPMETKLAYLQAMEAEFNTMQQEREELLAAIDEIKHQLQGTKEVLDHATAQNQALKEQIENIRSIVCTKE